MCHSSCKECSNITECTRCEESMVKNSTSGLCEYCPDGEFYDYTLSQCTSCGTSCIGLCAYQQKCFTCSPSEFLDLDTLVCKSSCDPGKIAISDSNQFAHENFCRNLNFYINPESQEIMELGTKTYPYRTAKPVFVEILKQHSHKDYNISIYVMENTNTFIEDSTSYIINITKVFISSYNDAGISQGMATITTTDSSVNEISQKAAFHLMKNATLDIASVLSGGNFTDYELDTAGRTGDGFHIIRSSFEMTKIIARRVAKSWTEGYFIYLLYLQNRDFTLRDMEFYVTGHIVNTRDPANIYIENLYVDTWNVASGFMFFPWCNYPEAHITPSFYANNFTAFVSSDELTSFRPNIFYYAGPGNVTCTNFNISDVYGLTASPLATFLVFPDVYCDPKDDLIKTIDVDTVYISLPGNEQKANINLIGVVIATVNGRKAEINLRNVILENAYRAQLSYFLLQANAADVFKFTDSVFKDYQTLSNLVMIQGGTVELRNLTFQDSSGNAYNSFNVLYCNICIMSGIYVKNYTGSGAPVGNMINFLNTPAERGTFNDISLTDSDLLKQSFISFTTNDPVPNLEFSGLTFTNVRKYASGSSFIQISSVKQLAISTLVFNNVSSSNSVSSDAASIVVTQVDLNFTGDIEISGVLYQNSSITLVSMPTFVNTPPTSKAINFRNMEFANCEFSSQGSIIKTEGIEYNLDLSLNFDNLSFSEILFNSRGNLLDLDQQLPTNLTISNSRFTNIQQGIINIASSNIENTALLTNVYLKNISASQIQQNEASFLNVLQGGRLHISDSSFTGMYTYQDGSVLTGGSSSTITMIHNSTFQNNYALNGGVFNVKEQSTIKLYSCNITDNFAITSGVINVVSNGQFKIYDSYIYNNYANVNPVSQLLDTAKMSLTSNTKIYSNNVFSKANLTLEFDSCSLLCFINQNFIDYSNTNFQAEISEVPNEYQFQLIFASLSITAGSEIFNEPLVVDSFVSTLEVSDIVIKNFITGGVTIRGVSSTMTLNNLTVQDFTMNNQSDYIFDALDSTVSITNSTSIMFRIRSSAVAIQGLTYETINNAEELGIISECYNSSISKLISTLSEVSGKNLLRIESSQNINLSDVQFENTQHSGLRILSSNITSVTNMKLKNCTEGLYIESSTVESINNSTLESNGGTSKVNGGGIHIVNSDVTLSNNTFMNNTASDGGAISFTCSLMTLCNLNIPDSKFESNNATRKGGAIYYNYKRPTLGQSIEYSSNSAQYGQNIASYAVKIIFNETSSNQMKIYNLGPGIAYDGTLRFAIKDYDNQIMVLDSLNQISIASNNSTVAEVKGFNIQPLVNGVASFDNFVVNSDPGQTGVTLTANSKAIDKSLISTVFGNQISNNTIEVGFRFCQPGEQILNNLCTTCAAGTYSLIWNSTQCHQCMDDVVCAGGKEINVNPGYWRASSNSTTIIECINKEACDGGYVESMENPTNCETGYEGNLCTKCSVNGNDKYQAVGNFVCQKCPNPILNAIRVFFVGVAVFAYFMVIIIVNVRKTSESQVSILLRILTNYVQILTLSISFSTKYPGTLSDILIPAETVGNSSEAFMSFDCFVMDSEIKGPFPSSIFFKLFLIIWLPLAIFLCVALIWVIVYYTKRRWVLNITRNLIISFISILFLLHPKLAQESINLFRCVQIDEGVLKARIDTDIGCYSFEHLKWCMILGLPILIIWVISMPLFALIVMYKKVYKAGEDNKLGQYFLILYQGLNTKQFYWEFVNSSRKILILISFLLPDYSKILFSSSVLLITWRIQTFLQPYKYRLNNEVEIFGVNIGIITLCCGMIFNQKDTSKSINNFLLVAMIVFNFIFILKWTHLLFDNFGTKYSFFKKAGEILSYATFQRPEGCRPDLQTDKQESRPGARKKKRPKRPKRSKRPTKKRKYKTNKALPKKSHPGLQENDTGRRFMEDQTSERRAREDYPEEGLTNPRIYHLHALEKGHPKRTRQLENIMERNNDSVEKRVTPSESDGVHSSIEEEKIENRYILFKPDVSPAYPKDGKNIEISRRVSRHANQVQGLQDPRKQMTILDTEGHTLKGYFKEKHDARKRPCD
ncbi:unnamed protein product [Moneuplotes crassus]|uniref:Uncharacterized protein n=1 Tax=Euplotes crassus TaxID=5936 RepID=A0AAD1XSS3_EUPCR|nr:unnamed protein product [Moneuplotes crassus]